MNPTRKKLALFRTSCKEIVPYMMHTIYSLLPVERPGVKTMAVDRYGRLYYDPAYVEAVSLDTGRWTILHETLHVVLNHAGMADKVLGPTPTARQCEMWNWACDIVVNQLLCAWMKDAPEGIITYQRCSLPPKLAAVQYYDLLMQQQDSDQPQEEESDDDQQQGDEASDDAGEDDESGADEAPYMDDDAQSGDDPDEAGGEADAEDDSEAGGSAADDGDGEEDGDRGEGGDAAPSGDRADDGGDEDGEVEEGAGGSSADGRPRSYELPPDPAHRDREYSMAQELEQAIEEAEASDPGSVPGELKAAVGAKLRPQPDPFDVLRGTVARAVASPVGAPDYTLRRMSRRQGELAGRLRGIKRETPSCVVILDTSGSMQLGCEGYPRAERAMGVIAKAISRLRSVRVVCWDTQAHSKRMLTSMRQFEVSGFGGTDMHAAIMSVDREYRPDAIVLVTDMEFRWGSDKPRARVVVAAVSGADVPAPAWAKVCDLTKGGA